MADESRFRPGRGQEQAQPLPRGGGSRIRRSEDPLAELARLIGQEDPFADFVPVSRQPGFRTSSNGNEAPVRRQDNGPDARGSDRMRANEPARIPEPEYEEVMTPPQEPRRPEAPRNNGRGAYAYRGTKEPLRTEMRPAAGARALRDEDYEPTPPQEPETEFLEQQSSYEPSEQAYADPRSVRESRAYSESRTYPESRPESRAYPENRSSYRESRAPQYEARQAYDESAYEQYQDQNANYDPVYTEDAYLPAHADEYYEEAPHNSKRRWILIGIALTGILVIGGTSVFAYRTLFGPRPSTAQPKVIKSESGPSKVAPGASTQNADLGGQKQIYDRVGGERPGTGERIVSREEQPIDVGAARPGSRAPATSSQAGAPAPQVIPSSPQTNTAAAASSGSTEPKRVRTVSIRADGTVVSDQAARNIAAAPRAGSTTVSNDPLTLNTYASQSGQAAGAETAAQQSARTNRPGPSTSAPVSNQNPWADIPANTRAATAPASATTSLPSQQAAVPPPSALRASAPAVVVQSPPPAGSYVVQVASQKTETDAQNTWQKLQQTYPAVLGNQQATIRRVDLGDRGIFYRAQLGPFTSRTQASELCQSLKSVGGECVLQRN